MDREANKVVDISEVFESLLGGFSGAEPASEQALQNAEAALAKHLPDDYKDFLRISDGGEGFLDGNYLILWSIGEVVEYEMQYETAKYAPGLVLFGSNGGGDAFAFAMGQSKPTVVAIPFVGMDTKYAKALAPSFVEFLRFLKDAK